MSAVVAKPVIQQQQSQEVILKVSNIYVALDFCVWQTNEVKFISRYEWPAAQTPTMWS